jgi:hypothetical protein
VKGNAEAAIIAAPDEGHFTVTVAGNPYRSALTRNN